MVQSIIEEFGAVCGDFQILHLGHMEDLLAAKVRCRKLYIGVEDPEKGPLTFYERMEMIQMALDEFGVRREDYQIVPIPHAGEASRNAYIPAKAVSSRARACDDVCRLIREGGDWQGQVPKSVYEFVTARHLESRYTE